MRGAGREENALQGGLFHVPEQGLKPSRVGHCVTGTAVARAWVGVGQNSSFNFRRPWPGSGTKPI